MKAHCANAKLKEWARCLELNANLISAAPEMLESLLKMQRTFEAMGPSFAAVFADTRDAVNQALAKARGES